jgi:hypothetical protein
VRDASTDWTPLGESFNTRYYLAAPDIAIVVPRSGLKDDEASARINIDFQTAWAKSNGDRCAVVVCLFNLLSQDSGARRVFAAGMDPISRAIGSFFMGLTKPGVPTGLVDTVEDGIAWCVRHRPRVSA